MNFYQLLFQVGMLCQQGRKWCKFECLFLVSDKKKKKEKKSVVGCSQHGVRINLCLFAHAHVALYVCVLYGYDRAPSCNRCQNMCSIPAYSRPPTHTDAHTRTDLAAGNGKDEKIRLTCCLNDVLINNAGCTLHM